MIDPNDGRTVECGICGKEVDIDLAMIDDDDANWLCPDCAEELNMINTNKEE